MQCSPVSSILAIRLSFSQFSFASSPTPHPCPPSPSSSCLPVFLPPFLFLFLCAPTYHPPVHGHMLWNDRSIDQGEEERREMAKKLRERGNRRRHRGRRGRRRTKDEFFPRSPIHTGQKPLGSNLSHTRQNWEEGRHNQSVSVSNRRKSQ